MILHLPLEYVVLEDLSHRDLLLNHEFSHAVKDLLGYIDHGFFLVSFFSFKLFPILIVIILIILLLRLFLRLHFGSLIFVLVILKLVLIIIIIIVVFIVLLVISFGARFTVLLFRLILLDEIIIIIVIIVIIIVVAVTVFIITLLSLLVLNNCLFGIALLYFVRRWTLRASPTTFSWAVCLLNGLIKQLYKLIILYLVAGATSNVSIV